MNLLYKITFTVLIGVILCSCSGNSSKGGNPNFSGYPTTTFTIQDKSELIGGVMAQGQVGDILLKNDRIRVIIQKPSKNAGIFSFGGIIIDADKVRSDGTGGDQFGSLFPFINVEWTLNYHGYDVISTGEEDGIKILRAYGTIDVYDYLDLDFVKEVASGAIGQELTFSRRFDDRGNPFTINENLKGLDTEVITDYRLPQGKSYVQIDTTFRNPSNEDVLMPVGDIINGSGELHFLVSGVGFGPDFMVQVSADTVCIIYEGKEGVDVSYGYFYDLSQFRDAENKRLASGSITYSGVTFLGLGEGITNLLPIGAGGTPKINFTIPAKGERTITRYFVVGDGSSSSVLEAGMKALKVDTATISGKVVTADGNPVSNAKVAVQKAGGGTIVVFRSNDKGEFGGKVPVGDNSFAKALGEGRYRFVVGKKGFHKNGTALAGECDPNETTAYEGMNLNITCTLGETATIEFAGPVIDSTTGAPTAARLTIVGEDPSPENTTGGVFEDITSIAKHPFGIVDNLYLTAKGTIGNSDRTSFSLEPGVYKFVFSHGVEYTTYEMDITVEAGSNVVIRDIAVQRVIETPGYILADFHLHNVSSPDSMIAPEQRAIGAAAEGMDILQSSDHDYLFDYGPVVERMQSKGYITDDIKTIVGEEVTPNHYGHMQAFLLAVNPDSPTGGAIDWSDTPKDEVSPAPDYCMGLEEIAEATRAFPGENVVQLNHISDNPTGVPVAAGWVTSRYYLESGAPLLSSFADPVERRLNPRTNGHGFPIDLGDSSLVFEDFDTVELLIGFDFHRVETHFIKSTLPTWFNFLNMGLRVTATGSSDSHDEIWNPMNWPRNYVASDFDPRDGLNTEFSADKYASAIKNQKVIVTGGVFLNIEAITETGLKGTIGDMISGHEVKVKIKAEAPSWAWFDTINIYANAEPVPIDDETGDAMSGSAATAEEFYKPYHVPHYATVPDESFKLSDGTLENWKEENGKITSEIEVTLNLTEDTWIVVLVRGTKDTAGFKSPFPLVVNVLEDPSKKPENFDPINLDKFHSAQENGAFAFGLANPIFVDADGDNIFKAKYQAEGVSPIEVKGER